MKCEIILEQSDDGKIYLFVNNEVIASWRGQRRVNILGKPLEMARAIELAFKALEIEVTLKIIDGSGVEF